MYRLLTITVFSIIFSLNIAYSQMITWVRTNAALSGNVNEVVVQDGAIIVGTVNGIHKSTDGGNTWITSNSGLANTRVFALAVKNNNEIYCGTHDGVYYSADKGATWTKRSEGISDNYITTIYIKDDTTLYAGTLYSGMFYTNNGGTSWVKVHGDFDKMAVNAIAVRKTGEVYVGTTNALYRSNAKGKDYIKMKNDLPEKQNVYTITIRRNGIVYFGTRKGKLYRTINNGNSWTLQLEIPEKIQIFTSLLTPGGTLILGTYGNGVYRSKDNAATWEQINNGLSNKKIMCLTQLENGNFFAGTWGSGVFRGAEPPITTSASGTHCAGEYIEISFTIKSGTQIDAGNIFYVEVSDEKGSFAKPDTIGKLNSTSAGKILCLLPKNLKTGLHNVRVVASSPKAIGSSAEIHVQALPDMRFRGKIKICTNAREQYSVPTQGNVRSLWFVNGGTIKSPATADTIDVQWEFAENASITLVRYNVVTQCSDTVYNTVTFYSVPDKPTITRMGDRLVSSANSGNQWFRNGEMLTGKTDKILELKEPGLYTVQVKNGFGCASPFSDEYNYKWNSVEDEELSELINVYPQPSAGKVNINFNMNEPSDVSIGIYTLRGELVGKRKFGYISESSLQTLDMTKFTTGTYYLRISINRKTVVKKIVIRK